MSLPGYVPAPPATAARWRAEGLWEGVTIAAMVERTAARLPDKLALVDGGRRYSYAELVARSRHLALRLADAGLAGGDRVVMQLPNIAEFVFAYLALTAIGAIPVMALRAHRLAEVRHFVRASGARGYLIPDVLNGFDYRELARTLQSEFPALDRVFVVGDPLPGQQRLPDVAGMGPADPAEVPAAGASAATTPAAASGALDARQLARLAALASPPDAVTTMLLSGGTTSMSKLIPRTHEDYVLNARLCGRAAGFDEQTVFMAILPLGHNYNLASPGLLGTFYYGGTVVLAPGTDTARVFELVERERVTVIAAVVPLIANWLAGDEPQRHDLSSLRVVQNGGARLAPELRARLRERLGCTPQEIYGTAEGLINMTRLDDPDELLLESSGAPVSEFDEIDVVDDDGRPVPDGTPGELITRGPYTIHGYFDAPEKNAEAFTADGFYRMGDIVRKRGRYVWTEGRRKDLINRGGEKISCDEVENLIHRHPDVRSVTLVAMPDPVFGEKACACVILHPGRTMTLPDLVAFLRAQGIASFKLPERLELMERFPVSPVGKILKRELREMIAANL